MSVVSVKEVFDQTADFSRDGSKYSRKFHVILTTDYLGPYVAANAGYPIPSPGAVYPLDAEAIVVSCTVRQLEGGKLPVYEVTINYDTAYDNPYLEPPTIQWGTKTEQEAVTVDVLYGYSIGSSAGEPFVPPLELDRYKLTCTITRNEPSFDPMLQQYYVGCVNTDYVWIANLYVAPGCALVKNITGTYVTRRLLGALWTFWSVSYEIELDPYSYVLYLLDHGTYYLDGDERVPFYDGDKLADRPKLLDGAGGPLEEGMDAEYGVFYGYFGVPFADLLLGYTLP